MARISAAVSQEEAAAAAVEEIEEAPVVEEEEAEEESEVVGVEESEVEGGEEGEVAGGGEEAVSASQPKENTKLYFGNLPYNCDSSQLAGIVQEYATPEMVEVIHFSFDSHMAVFL